LRDSLEPGSPGFSLIGFSHASATAAKAKHREAR
jgi:hypothetical protein